PKSVPAAVDIRNILKSIVPDSLDWRIIVIQNSGIKVFKLIKTMERVISTTLKSENGFHWSFGSSLAWAAEETGAFCPAGSLVTFQIIKLIISDGTIKIIKPCKSHSMSVTVATMGPSAKPKVPPKENMLISDALFF